MNYNKFKLNLKKILVENNQIEILQSKNLNYSLYDDTILRIKNLASNLDSNDIIIKEYYRRLERDAKNMLDGQVRINFLKKINEMKKGSIDPSTTTQNFIEKYNDKISDLAEQIIIEDVKKIIFKKNELSQKLSKNINNIVKRIDNFIIKEENIQNKKNVVNLIYNVIDKKMKKVVPYNKIGPISNWVNKKIKNF
jgi:hypothetical protein